VNAVLFDFGGVLTGPMEPLFAAIAESAGADPAELAALLLGAYDDGDHPLHRVERGELPFAELCSWARGIDVDALFDTVIDSCEVGVRKPNPAIYELTLERLGGLPPEEAVLLDDFEINLAGARALGIHGALVTGDTDAALTTVESLLAR
jgi:FMN phosphatase YigB (HAD superfamily)